MTNVIKNKKTDNNENNKKKDAILKFLTDFLPMIIFFTAYKLSEHPNPIIPATIYLVLSTLIALVISYIFTKKIAKIPLFSAILLSIFGGITVFSGNELFIKMKPTLLNSLFAIILYVGYFNKKPLLDYLFDGAIKMKKVYWLQFNLRWAIFFTFLAILNEIIWRNFSTDFWVQFKVFGMLPISIAFALINMPFILKNSR
jgi:intracellular septation protein